MMRRALLCLPAPWLVCACATIGAAQAPAAPAPDGTDAARSDGVLILGRVSNSPRKDYPALKALADYLARGLHDQGIVQGRVQFADTSDRMCALLREGRVDLAFDTVFPAVTYEDEAGAKVLLREWRDGLTTYRSVLFKRKDTPIAGLADLPGRIVAFERPGSTSAYFVPKADMLAAGLDLKELRGTTEPLAPDKVGYVFAGSENNIVVWVHRRLVAAGAFSDIDWDQDDDIPPVLRQDLEVFHTSPPLPRAVVLARQGLPAPIERSVIRVLVAADGDAAGREVLKQKHVTRYDAITPEVAASLAAARRLAATVP